LTFEATHQGKFKKKPREDIMTLASAFYPFDRENVFCGAEEWDAVLSGVAKENPEAARDLAVLMYETIGVISQGPAGVERALNTLKLGVERLFQHAYTCDLSLRLFLYEIEGLLSRGDLPAELIGGAIERAEATEAKFEAKMKKRKRV
jgi:hypothetical protein